MTQISLQIILKKICFTPLQEVHIIIYEAQIVAIFHLSLPDFRTLFLKNFQKKSEKNLEKDDEKIFEFSPKQKDSDNDFNFFNLIELKAQSEVGENTPTFNRHLQQA